MRLPALDMNRTKPTCSQNLFNGARVVFIRLVAHSRQRRGYLASFHTRINRGTHLKAELDRVREEVDRLSGIARQLKDTPDGRYL